MFLPYSLLAFLPGAQKVITAGTPVGLPVFSHCFRNCKQPGQVLGISLLGAVVCGILENSVMIGGTPILGVFAIALYVISAALLAADSKAPKISTNLSLAGALPSPEN
jgi:hypothetical protein